MTKDFPLLGGLVSEEPIRGWNQFGKLLMRRPSWLGHIFTIVGISQMLVALFPTAGFPEITSVSVPLWAWFIAALFLYMVSAARMLAEALEKAEKKLNEFKNSSADILELKAQTRAVLSLNTQLVRFNHLCVSMDQLDSSIRYERIAWETFKERAPMSDGLADRHYPRFKKEFEDSLKRLQDFAQNVLGVTVELSKHPNFDANPLAPVAGEDGLPEARKNDFRRLFDMHMTAQPLIDKMTRDQAQLIRQINHKLQELGKNS